MTNDFHGAFFASQICCLDGQSIYSFTTDKTVKKVLKSLYFFAGENTRQR